MDIGYAIIKKSTIGSSKIYGDANLTDENLSKVNISGEFDKAETLPKSKLSKVNVGNTGNIASALKDINIPVHKIINTE